MESPKANNAVTLMEALAEFGIEMRRSKRRERRRKVEAVMEAMAVYDVVVVTCC